MALASDLAEHIGNHLLPDPPSSLGVAVSGGGDSMALLHVLHEFCAAQNIQLRAVTVDHGLRAGSAEEAQIVANVCASLGIPHQTLKWTGWDGTGNLQSAARGARYRLMSDWARQWDISLVALGHTRDDQAETVLLRLARSAGVDGLSGMAPRVEHYGTTFLRPFLAVSREDLRDYLKSKGVDWVEDPSNTDLKFDRIKARKALKALAPLGLDASALGQVAANMGQARDALNWQCYHEARRIVRIDAGAVVLDLQGFETLPNETARRLIVKALRWVSGASYPPRRGPVSALVQSLKQGCGATVDGCQVHVARGAIWVFREFNAVKNTETSLDSVWDGRWLLSGPAQLDGLCVRALGETGLGQCPEWRETGRPFAVLLSTPAVWSGEKIIAAPLARPALDWQAEVVGNDDAFFATLLSH